MKIKITAIAVLFLLASNYLIAQTSDAEADAIINLLGVQKREAMSKMVNIATKDSVAFWKLYDEYNEKNKASGRQRMRLFERTAQAYGGMNDKIADSLAKVYFANRLDQEKTLESYYQKIKAATTATTAFEFYQGEVYLLTSLRAQIMRQIPTYGEIIRAQANQNR